MKKLIKVCVITLAISLVAILLPACGGGETTPPTTPPPETPTGNQAPVISSITFSPDTTTVAHGVILTIVCNATDPDGDTLTFSWSADAGTVDVDNQILTWTAPNFDKEVTISVTVDDGQGKTTTQSRTIAVVTNQRPVITSLTAEKTKVIPGGVTSITCMANDPDGDTLAYTWSASGGTVSGQGNSIAWQAAEKDGDPIKDGDYVVSVAVNDGKSGITQGQYTITVQPEAPTIILKPIASESGSVYITGDIVSSFLAGDNADNKGVRAYFSFDVSSLIGATIKEATLTFTPKETANNPWTISAFLLVEKVDYDTRPLQGGDFTLAGIEVAKYTQSPPSEVNVFTQLDSVLRPPAKPRLQFRIRLGGEANSNYNHVEDFISFSDASLTVTYSE